MIARGRRLRDVGRLVESYGGRAAGWVKKSSPVCEDAEGIFEFHWYECSGIGRVELKKKRLEDS
ncbi:MAG TPA: hypothetical protein VF017_20190 [Thermoanaerobaculia bacterium]|nr:hypothetical protein [Thermoanaerobaculia bacterium]